MRSETHTPPRAVHAMRPLIRWLAAIAADLRWAMEMSRRCERERMLGRRLDFDAISRIARETDAWAGRSLAKRSLAGRN